VRSITVEVDPWGGTGLPSASASACTLGGPFRLNHRLPRLVQLTPLRSWLRL
jgi:hypothetical protein